MESKINRKQNCRVAKAFGFVCYNYTPKYFEITLVASDMILLMFSNNF
jgi:hypothetical protein